MQDIEDNVEFCDSDDDLLGITDTPIDIRSYRIPNCYQESIPISRPYIKSPEPQIQRSSIKQITSPTLFLSDDKESNSDGWNTCYNKSISKLENTDTKLLFLPILKEELSNSDSPESNLNIRSLSEPNTDKVIFDNNNNPSLLPELDSTSKSIKTLISSGNDIELNLVPEPHSRPWSVSKRDSSQNISSFSKESLYQHSLQKHNRYQRMREISGVIGFIVNVHDATNFDIDLEISPELHEKYGDVISNQYTYQDFNNNFFEFSTLSKIKCINPCIGTTYRCRLRGVGINQLPQHLHTWKSNQMCVEIKQLIDRTDGWITCTLSDIDVYQRLLVDITINTCKGPIDLREYLLTRMLSDEHKDHPIFYHYTGKKPVN